MSQQGAAGVMNHAQNNRKLCLIHGEERAPQHRPPTPDLQSLDRSEAREGAESASAPGPVLAKGTRCLIVDDVPAQRLILSTIVSSLGAGADVASDGAQAVLMAQQQRYDLIFMDVSMPSMDGLTAAKLIRSNEQYCGQSKAKIYIVTSHDSYIDILNAADAGADGHINKPVSVKNIVNAILSSLKRGV